MDKTEELKKEIEDALNDLRNAFEISEEMNYCEGLGKGRQEMKQEILDLMYEHIGENGEFDVESFEKKVKEKFV